MQSSTRCWFQVNTHSPAAAAARGRAQARGSYIKAWYETNLAGPFGSAAASAKKSPDQPLLRAQVNRDDRAARSPASHSPGMTLNCRTSATSIATASIFVSTVSEDIGRASRRPLGTLKDCKLRNCITARRPPPRQAAHRGSTPFSGVVRSGRSPSHGGKSAENSTDPRK